MQKKVLALHDLSGFGRSSLVPIIAAISAAGHQCVPLPTEQTKAIPEYPAAVKSRHKGKKPQKPPRQTTPCSAWLTGKPSEPRARAWAMTDRKSVV